ncbi:hypothetical protein K4F52_002363 [Lecanicillium sp. MT-2017a]|nr:hypothetical protein K4F52_002363 [Lecanicillium sp. MT-2017a]
MAPKSLVDLATAVCIKNIKGLESVGDYLPYESVRHILIKVETAYQLRQIELNSPQIQGATGEIWLRLIERDFPLEYKAKGYKPQNQSKWYRVWEKYKKDHDRSLQESEEKLRNALAGLKQDKEKNTSKIVDGGHLPRRPKPRRRGPKDNTTSVLTFGGGSRTKTVNGASVMRKVRREVKEIRNIQGSLSQSIRPPSMRTSQQQPRLSKAPSSMVDEKRIAAQPAYRPPQKEPSPTAVTALEEFQERAAYITDSGSDSEPEDSEPEERPPSRSRRRASPPPVDAKPPVAAKPAVVAKPAVRPSGSMMQRKFGGRVGAAPKPTVKSEKQPVRTAPATASSVSSAKKPSTNAVKPPAPAPKPEPSNAGPSSPTKPAKPATQYLPRTQTSPPPGDGGSPPPAGPSLPATSPGSNLVRKRKPVDIFMRRKKRV